MNPDRPDNLEDQLSAYLDGELADAERADVEAYLATSEGARRTLADLKRGAELLRTLPRAKAPDGLLELVSAQIERRELLGGESGSPSVGRPPTRNVGRWLASAAAIAMTVSAGYLTYSHYRQGPAGPTPSTLGPLVSADKRELKELPRRELEDYDRGARRIEAKDRGDAGKADLGDRIARNEGVVETAAKDAKADERGRAATPSRLGAAPAMKSKVGEPVPAQPAPAPVVDEAARPSAPAKSGPAPMGKTLAKKGGRAEFPQTEEYGTAQEQMGALSASGQGMMGGFGGGGGYGGADIARRSGGANVGTFEVRLAYASPAARDAAAETIEHALRRYRLVSSDLTTQAVADTQMGRAPDVAGVHSQPSGLSVAGVSTAGTTEITLEGRPSAVNAAIATLERAAARTNPVSMAISGGTAEDWVSVQSADRQYQARERVEDDALFAYGERFQSKQAVAAKPFTPAVQSAEKDEMFTQAPATRSYASKGAAGPARGPASPVRQQAAASSPAASPAANTPVQIAKSAPPAGTRPAVRFADAVSQVRGQAGAAASQPQRPTEAVVDRLGAQSRPAQARFTRLRVFLEAPPEQAAGDVVQQVLSPPTRPATTTQRQ